MLKKTIIALLLTLLSAWIAYWNSSDRQLAELLWTQYVAKTTEQNISSILKIKSFEYSELENYFYEYSHGSAVYIWSNKILTNAHVVLSEDNEVLWNYEVCQTTDFTKAPECKTAAKLLYINIEKDLAVLELADSIVWMQAVDFWKWVLWIGDDIELIGYPANGNDTITLTTWKVSWFTQGFYKTDANIDSGNSGWGAFNKNNLFVWIPSAWIVWLTTLWLIIPLNEIHDFIDRRWNIIYYWEEIPLEFTSFIHKKKTTLRQNNIQDHWLTATNLSSFWYKISDYNEVSTQGLIAYDLIHSDKKTQIQFKNSIIGWTDFSIVNWLYELTKDESESTREFKTIVKKITLKWKEIFVYIEIDIASKDIYLELIENWMEFSVLWNLQYKKWINDALKLYMRWISYTPVEWTQQSPLSMYGISINPNSFVGMYWIIPRNSSYSAVDNIFFIQWKDKLYPIAFSWIEFKISDQWKEDLDFLKNPYSEYLHMIEDDLDEEYDDYSVKSWVVTNKNGVHFLVVYYLYKDETYIDLTQYNKNDHSYLRYWFSWSVWIINSTMITQLSSFVDWISVTWTSSLWIKDKKLLTDFDNILK